MTEKTTFRHGNAKPATAPGHPRSIVLASTSRYRRELLARLGLPFTAAAPRVDEAPLTGERPAATALRLAEAKARSLAGEFPDALIIGSDQVADVGGEAVSKPGDHDTAVAQLRRLSGNAIVFHTGLALLDAASGRCATAMVDVVSRFRELGDGEIEAYLRAERPYDCAGAVKSESLGIALFEAIDSSDPTALIGLPLIRLVSMLRDAGVGVLLQRGAAT